MKTEEIQEEIERTRTEMASTLDAIEQRLSPRQLMDQAVDTMRELASDQSRVGHVVRENPIPLALIGLGLGWLAISGMSRRSRAEPLGEYEGYEAGYEEAEPSAWASPGAETYGSAYGGESGYGGQAQRGGVREKASQMAEQAREGLSRASERTRTRVSQWSQSARTQASQAADRTWEAYQEHPITMGAVAVLLGAAFGAILPRSRIEAEMLGPQARQALRQAKETAGELAERAGQVAETAMGKAKEEAKEALQEVREAAKDEAQRQGLTGSTMTH